MGVPGWPTAPQAQGPAWGQPPAAGGPVPRTLVRQYHGGVQEANGLFRYDAARLAEQGYVPISQDYVQGSYGCGAFLVALLLCIILVGILIFIFMLIVKPAGTLTVTYAYQPAPTPFAPPPPPLPTGDLASRLRELDEALNAGLITPEQHAAKRAEMLQKF
jgi:hypothetical protein